MSEPITERIKKLYPAPIAAAYFRMIRIGGQEAQVREKHERLLSLFQAILQYLGLVGAAHYRRRPLLVQIQQSSARTVEEKISSLERPSLGQWMGLAESTARALHDSPGLPLMSEVSRFLFDITPDPAGPLTAAHRAIADWYPKVKFDKGKPGSHAAFLNRFITYRNNAVGHAIELPPSNWEYTRRIAVLLPAFDALLEDMEFLTRYPLAFVNEIRTYNEEAITHELVLFMGRESTTEEYRSPRNQSDLEAIVPKHMYLCSRDRGLKPFLDLHPFFIGGLCEHDGLALFPYIEGGYESPVFLCCLCSAERLNLEKQIERDQKHLFEMKRDLERIFSTERWEDTQKRKAREQVLPQLAAPIRYALQDGRIDADDVQFLEHTRRMCDVPVDEFPNLLVATIIQSGQDYGPEALESLRVSYGLERKEFIRLIVQTQVDYRQWGDNHIRVLGALRELYGVEDTELMTTLLEAALADHELDEGELTFLQSCVRSNRINMQSSLQAVLLVWNRSDLSKSVRNRIVELLPRADSPDVEPSFMFLLRYASQADASETVWRVLECLRQNGQLTQADLLRATWGLWLDDMSATQRSRMLVVIQRACQADAEELALASLQWGKEQTKLPITEAALISFFVSSGLDDQEAKGRVLELENRVGIALTQTFTSPPVTLPDELAPIPASTDASSPSNRAGSMSPVWAITLSGIATHVAMLTSERPILVTTDQGEGLVLDGEGKTVARRNVGGRINRVLADGAGRAAIGSWEGEVHYVQEGVFAWHRTVSGVVAALALGGQQLPLVVGTWSGEVVAFGADGKSVWTSPLLLPDAVSSVAVADADASVLAATYGGTVALYDPSGNIRWRRDYRDAIVQASFLPGSTDLLIAQKGGVLRCLTDNQIFRWEYEAKASFVRVFILRSPQQIVGVTIDGRVIVLSHDGQVDHLVNLGFAIGDAIASPDSQYIYVSADAVGILAYECAARRWTHEVEGRTGPMTSSPDGTLLVLAERSSVTLLRSPRPEVAATIEWKLGLQVGRFSLITVKLTNHGKRAARKLEVELMGEIDFAKGEMHRHTIERLEVNEECRLEWSIWPNTSGYIPLRINIGLRDDAGHRFEETHLVRVEAMPAM